MTERIVKFHSITPRHPRRPELSTIELHVSLTWLNGFPVGTAVLTEADLIRIIEQAALGLRVLREQRERDR